MTLEPTSASCTSIDQRYAVICEALLFSRPAGDNQYADLIIHMKEHAFTRERIILVLHQLFFARLPKQDEIETLIFYLDNESEQALVERLLSSSEYTSGIQGMVEFESLPSSELLVDVSHTLRFEFNSGIQRVVRCLTKQLRDQQRPHRLIELDHTLGGYRLVDSKSAISLYDWEAPAKRASSQQRSGNKSNSSGMSFSQRVVSKLKKRVRKFVGRRVREKLAKASLRIQAGIRKRRHAGNRGGDGAVAGQSTCQKLLFIWNNELLLPELIAEQRCLEKIHPLLSHAALSSTLIVFDMIPIQNPEYFVSSDGYVRYLSLFRCVDRISCISRAIESDVRQFMPLVDRVAPPPVVATHYLGGDFADADVVKPSVAVGADESRVDVGKESIPLVLTVGSIEVRKNHRRILRAMVLAQKKGCKFRGVFAGYPGWLNEGFLKELAYFQSQGFDIELRSSVSEAELLGLYDEAAFTMYCSMAEGFGLPIVESVMRGVPCITSNRGCMQEIAEQIGGCVLADPMSETSLCEAIDSLLSNPQLLSDLTQTASEATWTNWADYADAIYEFVTTQADLVRANASRAA